jgi:hypothetical protein
MDKSFQIKSKEGLNPHDYHRFLDEAGDTAFYGKGRIPIIGSEGVSKCFILGMLKIKESLPLARQKVIDLQNKIATDPYFFDVSSIQKKIGKGGYFIHAKDDLPEVRKMVFEFINSLNCSFEAVWLAGKFIHYMRKSTMEKRWSFTLICFHIYLKISLINMRIWY